MTFAAWGIVFVIVYMIYGFFATLSKAAGSVLIANMVLSSCRGVGYALLFLPWSIMGAVALVVSANLSDLFGMTGLFPMSILVSMVGLVILVMGIREKSV